MLVKQQPLKEFCSTLVKATKLVKFMMAKQQWIGWLRNKKEESQSHLLAQLVNGTDIKSTSSTRQDTLTSQLKFCVRLKFLMVQFWFWAQEIKFNLKQKLFGAKQMNVKFLLSFMLTKWIETMHISTSVLTLFATDFTQPLFLFKCQLEWRNLSRVLSTFWKWKHTFQKTIWEKLSMKLKFQMNIKQKHKKDTMLWLKQLLKQMMRFWKNISKDKKFRLTNLTKQFVLQQFQRK